MITGVLRATVASVVGLGLVVSLSACNRNYEILGPYSLGYDGEKLLIGVCADLRIDRISLLETRGSRTREDTRLVWDARGDLGARGGETLVVAGANAGLRNEIAANELRALPGSLLELGLNDASEATLSASFEIPDEGIVPGAWLTPTGEIRETPCLQDDTTQ